jgi:phage tail sheath gpL-like
VFLRKCKTSPFEVAANVAADHAAIGHPAIPLNNRELPYLDAPDIADRLEWSEINSLLWNGVTPLNADQSNAVRIVRSITSYTRNDAGSPDPLFLDTTKIAILDYTRQAVKERQLKEFGSGKVLRDNHADGEPAFVVTPQDIRSVNIDVALRLEKTGCLQNVKKLKDSFVSSRDANVAGRVNSSIPVETVEGLHVLANTISVTTTI